VGDGGPKGFDQRIGGRGEAEIDAVETLVPVASGGGQGGVEGRRALPPGIEIPGYRRSSLSRDFRKPVSFWSPEDGRG